MSECKHLSVTRWYFDDTGECCDLWACTECRQRFEPLRPECNEVTQRTHWDACWKSGPEHYECAVGQVERLRTEYARLAGDYSEEAAYLRKRAEQAEAEVERLRSAVSAAREIVDEFYGPTKCDCDPSVGINSCHVCTIRGAIDAARGEQ